jgi:hypothetical protein
MSTKTNFKRVALVAVASLGLGLLGAIPAKATISGVTITTVNGTAGLAGVRTDSTNAATFTVAATFTAATDSLIITVVQKSVTAGMTPNAAIRLSDTNTGLVANSTVVDTIAAYTQSSAGNTAQGGTGAFSSNSSTRTDTAGQVAAGGTGFSGKGSNGASSGFIRIGVGSAAPAYVSATFFLQMDSYTSTRVAGTYSADVIATYFSAATGAESTVTTPVSITIAAAASASLVANATYSTAVLSEGTSDAGSKIDSTVSVLATASSTTAAVVLVTLRNVSNVANAQESITATITAGTIGDGTTQGRSVVLVASAGANTLQIKPDGTAGTATISISTPSVTFAAKTMTFYSATPSTVVATKRINTIAVGSNTGAITVVAKDANGIIVGGNTTIYAFSDALTVVSETASACTYDSPNNRHTCTLTGVAAGTANITVGTASKSVVGKEIAVTVSTNPAVALKMEWHKTTYAPGEKAFLKVWAVDSAGKPVAPQTITNLVGSTYITTSAGFTGAGTPELPTTTSSVTLAKKSLSSNGLESLEPIGLYTVYMPNTGGPVTVTAVGGTSLPISGQVTVTATATVTDNAAAALAAVTALATTVASLKTLITTLTNLVLKIQKKVKA